MRDAAGTPRAGGDSGQTPASPQDEPHEPVGDAEPVDAEPVDAEPDPGRRDPYEPA